MPGIQLSGLFSGFDWHSVVDQLVTLQRTPETRMNAQKAAGQQKTASFEALKTKLTDLQTAVKAFSGSGVFGGRSAALSDTTSGWNATASPGAATGEYDFQVTQTATKAQLNGVADAGAALSSTNDVSGVLLGTMKLATAIKAGDFTVNGQKITVALSDSLQDVFNNISTATGGAVTGSYDATTDRVRLSSASPIVLGSANDTSNFLTALQLHNNGTGEVLAPTALGVVSVSAAILNANLRAVVSAVDGAGAGSFKVNGVDFSYHVNTDSIQSVVQKINDSSAGVTAAYDKTADRFTLTNKSTGDVGISVQETAGGLLGALGLTAGSLVRGNDAIFTVNGSQTFVSASNVLDESVHGISGLSVTATSATSQTVSVSTDSSGVRSKIDDFITKYNAVQNYIQAQTKSSTAGNGRVTASTLTGNREVSGISSDLRRLVFDAVPGLSGTLQRFEAIGIDFKTGTSELEIKDSTKLDSALLQRPNEVGSLFTQASTGLVARLDDFITKSTALSGTIATQLETITKTGKTIDTQIANLERRITQQRAQLEASFIQMEDAQRRFQQQSQVLTNSFSSSSS